MLEGAGFEVAGLGADVSPERFVTAAKEKGANIVCLSALLTVTMPSMKATVEAFRTAGTRGNVKMALNENVKSRPFHATFLRTRNSVFNDAIL
jgi:5-methyltetrahydrofolate--homocysteine methyltransferase